MHFDRPESTGSTPPRITIPEPAPITPGEIERRRELFKRTVQHRDESEPIGMPTEDLIHELRGGDERFDT